MEKKYKNFPKAFLNRSPGVKIDSSSSETSTNWIDATPTTAASAEIKKKLGVTTLSRLEDGSPQYKL